MEIKKILFVTKFEDLSFNALLSLLELRKAALEHVVFVSVIEKDRVAMRRGAGYLKEEEIRLRETANIRFIDWAESLFEKGMEVGVYILVGSLVGQVIDAAEKEETDLIVIGRSTAKGILQKLYSGSDVIELIQRSSFPVLVYKHDGERSSDQSEQPFSRPLLAMDWSPASLRAVEYLKAMKDVIEEVSLVNVVDEKELTGSSSLTIQKTRKEKRAELDTIVDILEAEGIPARPHIYIGNPAEEIELAARECRSTLIVLGTSTKPAFVERWLGSLPKTVAEKSNVDTLLIPPVKE